MPSITIVSKYNLMPSAINYFFSLELTSRRVTNGSHTWLDFKQNNTGSRILKKTKNISLALIIKKRLLHFKVFF